MSFQCEIGMNGKNKCSLRNRVKLTTMARAYQINREKKKKPHTKTICTVAQSKAHNIWINSMSIETLIFVGINDRSANPLKTHKTQIFSI